MKKLFSVLILGLLVFIGCSTATTIVYDVTYSVTFGTTAEVYYIDENGTEIFDTVITPWEYSGTFYTGDIFGFKSEGDNFILSEVSYYSELNGFQSKSEISDKPIMIYFYK